MVVPLIVPLKFGCVFGWRRVGVDDVKTGNRGNLALKAGRVGPY